MKRMCFFSKHGSASPPTSGDAAAQVASKCCKLQQLHHGLSLWWSLDGSLTSFCDKQSGDAAADIGATLSCAAGGYGASWPFAEPQIKGMTNGECLGHSWTHLFVRAIFKFVRAILGGEGVVSILEGLAKRCWNASLCFSWQFSLGPLALQKNPSLVWLTWSREETKGHGGNSRFDFFYVRWPDLWVVGWQLLVVWTSLFFLTSKMVQQILFNPWTSSLFRLPVPPKPWWKEGKRSGEEHFVAVILACRLFTSPSPWKQRALKLIFGDLKLRTF